MKRTTNKFQKCWCRWLLWVALGSPAAGASPGYQVAVWRAEEGLPQGTVTSIAQTLDGYLWLGTQNGLVRFDGVSFKIFNEKNTPAIANNRIVQLYVDRRGALWVGAEQGKIARYQDGAFSSYEMPGFGTTFNYVRVFCDDAAARLWMVSCEWQLLRLADGAFSVLSTNWGLSGPDALASDRAGIVYIGTERELATARDGGFRVLWSQANETNFKVEFLTRSHSGGCWVAGNGRLRKFEAGSWVADLGSYAWTNSPIYGLHEDRRNRLWVATLGGGLFRYDPDGTVLHLTTRDGLPTDFVRCVTEDREGNIWAGTEGGGLCRLKPAIFDTLGARQGLSSDQVLSVCEAIDGSHWIGMNGSGLDHVVDGRVEHYGAAQGLMNGHVWSVVQDAHGTIWAGTWGGLFKLETNRFVNVSDGHAIGGVVLAIHEDRTGALLLGQQAIGALTRVRGNERSTLNIAGASPSLDLRVLLDDRDGNLWIGSQNEGLYRWKEGGETLHIGKKDGLASQSIWSLAADEDGTVWIGTCGGGLSRWRNGSLATWTTRNGLANDVVCQILDDRRGNLWLGSYGGVFRVSKAELERSAGAGRNSTIHCTTYGKADGLPSIECQGGFQPSGLKARDGRLWFPTIKGLAIVNPDQVATNFVPPIVIVEDLVIDGVAQPLPSPAATPTSGNGAQPPVKIQPGGKNLQFRYTATSLTAPEKVRFKYRLEGLEQDWISAGTERAVTYSRLPPGEYKFHVAACNNDGIWNERGDTLAVKVLPHFWQTKWFLALSALASLATAAGFANFVAARRMQRRLELVEHERAVERERRRIAQDMHDDLGSHLTEIALLSEFAQNPDSPPEAVQEDVRKIMTRSRALTAALDEIVWAVDPENDSLESFVTYACSFAETHLQIARISCRLELPGQLPNVVLMTEVRHNLFLTFKEALNNAVKHSHASEVRIAITHEAGMFAVTIRDNGVGIAIAGDTDPKSPPREAAGGSGTQHSGWVNMRERMAAIHGRCEVRTAPGEGTEVRLSVALPAA